MGRKSRDQLDQEAQAQMPAEQYQAEVQAHQISQAQQATAKYTEVLKTIGRVQGIGLMRHFATVAELKMLSELKESKQYIGMVLLTAEGRTEIRTWEEFCTIGIGMSRRKIDDDLLNLNMFGEEFMDHSQRLGLGVRELKKLRQLPDEAREEIIDGEFEEMNKDDLLERIEELVVKNTAEKDHLKKKLKAAADDLQAKDRVLQSKAETLTKREQEIEKLQAQIEHGIDPDTLTESQQEMISQISNSIINRLYELDLVINEVRKRDDAPQHLIELAAGEITRVIDRSMQIRNMHQLVQGDDIIIETDEEFIEMMNESTEH